MLPTLNKRQGSIRRTSLGYERAISVHGNNDGRTQTDVRKNDALFVHGKNKYRENPNGAAYLISHKVNNNKDTTYNT